MDSTKEALNVLPSLFEDFIDIDDLKFFIKKLDNNRYLSFAYDENRILEALIKSNLTINQVSNIFFAQNELEVFTSKESPSCMKVDNICLSYIDGILSQIPAVLKVDINNSVDINNIKLSKNSIYINNSSKYLDTKVSYILSSLLLIVSLVMGVRYINNTKMVGNIAKSIDKIKLETKMPQTVIETKSILNQLEKTYQKQSNIRKAFDYILSSKDILKGGVIVSVDFNNNKFNIRYKDIKKKNIQQYFSKQYKISKIISKNNIVTVGFKI